MEKKYIFTVDCTFTRLLSRSTIHHWCFHLTACDSAFFTSNIHRRRQIDPRLAFRLESLTFSMEGDS